MGTTTLQRDMLVAIAMTIAFFGVVLALAYTGLFVPGHLMHHGAQGAMPTKMRR